MAASRASRSVARAPGIAVLRGFGRARDPFGRARVGAEPAGQEVPLLVGALPGQRCRYASFACSVARKLRHGTGIVAGGAKIADAQLVGLEFLLARVALDIGLRAERRCLPAEFAAGPRTLGAAQIAAQQQAGGWAGHAEACPSWARS